MQKNHVREKLFLYIQNHYERHNIIKSANGINPLKTDMKYIWNAYDLNIGVGIKFQSQGC